MATTLFTQNTIETLRTSTDATKVSGNLAIYNPTTGSTASISGNKLNYNNVQQVVMDETFTQVGDKSYGDSNGQYQSLFDFLFGITSG